MRLKPVIDLLKSAFPQRRVSSALAFAKDLDLGQFSQDLYVVPLRRKDGENTLINVHRQKRVHTFAVVIAARSVNTPGGGDADDQIEDAIDDITDALVGISLPGHELPVSSVGGQLLQFKGGVAIWQEEFTSQTNFRRIT